LSFPIYNPGPRIGPHLASIVEVLKASGSTFEVIAMPGGLSAASRRLRCHDLTDGPEAGHATVEVPI